MIGESNNEIIELRSSIEKLNNELLAERNKNKRLTDENKKLRDELNKYKIKNNQIIINQNDNLINDMKIQIDLNNRMLKINDEPKKSKKNENQNLNKINTGEKILNIHFKSIDLNIDLSIPCKKTDIFVILEAKLYDEYPEFREYNNLFTCNGLVIKKWKSLEENNIKNDDKIDILRL